MINHLNLRNATESTSTNGEMTNSKLNAARLENISIDELYNEYCSDNFRELPLSKIKQMRADFLSIVKLFHFNMNANLNFQVRLLAKY